MMRFWATVSAGGKTPSRNVTAKYERDGRTTAIADRGEEVVGEVGLKHHSPTHGCQEQRSDTG